MSFFRVFCGIGTLLVITLAAQPTKAQSDPNFETGLKAFGSYLAGNIDRIDLLNGALNVDIPLISYPQRGGKLKLAFTLHYHNSGTYANQYCIKLRNGQRYCTYQAPNFLDHGFSLIQEGTAMGSISGSPQFTNVDYYYGSVGTPDGRVANTWFHLMQCPSCTIRRY